MSEVCVICNRCTRRLWPDISSCLFAILFIHITNKLKRRLLIFHLALPAPLSTNFSPPDSVSFFLNRIKIVSRRCVGGAVWIYLLLYFTFSVGVFHNPFSTEPPPPHAPPSPTIVNSERPCDAFIVEVTGMSAEYAKPPVNPIKWSELAAAWRELAICFQDLSRRGSKVLLLHGGPHL